jgi:CheY-like chemotaxis protein/signal transduction histidine kinase
MTKILIVEDERIIAWNIQEVLQVTGHDVISSVSTAEEAIAIARQQQPDLVLMDIRLNGELDGIAAAEHIYNSYGIPTVYLTAHADDYTVNRAMATAPFGYVLKPFKRNELLLAIKVALHRHQQEQLRQKAQQPTSLMVDALGDQYLAEGIDHFLNSLSTVPASVPLVPSGDADTAFHEDGYANLPYLSHLTSVVRRSLDDKTIISTLVQDLGAALALRSCHVSLHSQQSSDVSTIIATYCQGTPDLTHFSLNEATRTSVLDGLAFQVPVQFCTILTSDHKAGQTPHEERLSVLVCPLLNQHGAVIGDIMVTKAVDSGWDTAAIAYVQSVADQCVVSLRQSLLYHIVQNEMQSKQKPSPRAPLSEQWISSLSHELRNPIANIKMATQMLGLVVNTLDDSHDRLPPAKEYLRILQYECERETRLVDAIVETHQDSTTQVLTFNVVSLQELVDDVVGAYCWQIEKKHQRLDIHYSPDALDCKTAPSILKRVLSELLDYACRHSAPEAVIQMYIHRLSADHLGSPSLLLSQESGIPVSATAHRHSKHPIDADGALEILIRHKNAHTSAAELNAGLRSFGDTDQNLKGNQPSLGLGLYLAKIQVEKLSGQFNIEDSNQEQLLTFSIRLPGDPEQQSSMPHYAQMPVFT